MPRVTRSRAISAPPERVWFLVADPHHLPRWWPRVARVEDVQGQGRRARWTAVLGTARGASVRADFRCAAASEPRRLVWEQEIAGTPFERVLRASRLEIEIEADPPGSRVTLTSDESARGFARLGGGMLKAAARRRLDEALEGLELAVAP